MARILVVDDDRDVIGLLEYLAKKEGLDVIESLDGKEGLSRAKADLPDLIILDIMMPELDGFTVAQRLSADPATQQIPVIILTAKVHMQDAFEPLSNVRRYITKPFDPTHLLSTVRTLLEKKPV